MVDYLKSGGDDGRYTFIGSENMTQYNLSAKYIIQANHMTIDYHYHYNDTQNYLLYGDNATSTTVRAFSISGRYGAYCDYSQNYKILVGSLSATDLYSKMVGNLKSGGDDGRYTFIGSENMTQYNLYVKGLGQFFSHTLQ
jgi:hypothetical protein